MAIMNKAIDGSNKRCKEAGVVHKYMVYRDEQFLGREQDTLNYLAL